MTIEYLSGQSMSYYEQINEGNKYACDKCQVVNLSENEYENYIQFQFHYCELCWNYLHLKKGECSKCHTSYTNRNEYPEIFIDCSCGNKVELTW